MKTHENVTLKNAFLLFNTTRVRNNKNTIRFIFSGIMGHSFSTKNKLLFKKALKETFVTKIRQK